MKYYNMRLCFSEEGQAYNDLLNTMRAIVEPKGGTILSSFGKEFRIISAYLDDVLPEVEQWSKANPDVSCWLQYYEDNDLSLPYSAGSCVGVREYVNGKLVYSMEGGIGHKEKPEPEKTLIEGKNLTIYKSDGKGGDFYVDGNITVDERVNYYAFNNQNPYK